jgi:hypothetical protein
MDKQHLRDQFFKEHTLYRGVLAKVVTAPHDLFEWFWNRLAGEAAAPSVEQLLEQLAEAKYKSFGFGAVMLWKMTDSEGEKWECKFRNEADNWKDAKTFEGDTPKEALQGLYDYAISKNYITP